MTYLLLVRSKVVHATISVPDNYQWGIAIDIFGVHRHRPCEWIIDNIVDDHLYGGILLGAKLLISLIK